MVWWNSGNSYSSRMNPSIFFRDATPADALSMIDYLNEVAAETVNLSFGPGEFRKTIEEEEAIIRDHLDSDNQFFLIAEDQGRIIGHITISANQKTKMRHIGDVGISIRKDYWRQGIGEALMQQAIDWAKGSISIRKLNLNVLVTNKGAVALYEKVGFEIEGTLRRDMYLNGSFTDAYQMGMLIN